MYDVLLELTCCTNRVAVCVYVYRKTGYPLIQARSHFSASDKSQINAFELLQLPRENVFANSCLAEAYVIFYTCHLLPLARMTIDSSVRRSIYRSTLYLTCDRSLYKIINVASIILKHTHVHCSIHSFSY